MSNGSKVLIYLSFLLKEDVFYLLLQLQTIIWLLCIFIYKNQKLSFSHFILSYNSKNRHLEFLNLSPQGLISSLSYLSPRTISIYDNHFNINLFSERGEFRVDSEGTPTLLNCLMYKLSYYRFGDLKLDYQTPAGFDRTRNAVIGHKDFDLTYLEEAYTTEHWLVRIYR